MLAALLAVQPSGESLRAAGTFSTIPDRRERSLALFAEASKVLLHPRCVHSHPPDARPRQGDGHLPHKVEPVFDGLRGDRGSRTSSVASAFPDERYEAVRAGSFRAAVDRAGTVMHR